MICKTGSYVLGIFVAYQLALRSKNSYVFWQHLKSSSFTSKPKIMISALGAALKDMYHMPLKILKIGIIYALLRFGMYVSDPYEKTHPVSL